MRLAHGKNLSDLSGIGGTYKEAQASASGEFSSNMAYLP